MNLPRYRLGQLTIILNYVVDLSRLKVGEPTLELQFMDSSPNSIFSTVTGEEAQ